MSNPYDPKSQPGAFAFRENQIRFERGQAAYTDRVRQSEWEQARNRCSLDTTPTPSLTFSPGEAGGCLIMTLALFGIVVVLLTPILWITLGLGIIGLLVWGLVHFFHQSRGDRLGRWATGVVFSALIASVGSLMLWWGGRPLSAQAPKTQPAAKTSTTKKGKDNRKPSPGKRQRNSKGSSG